MRTLFACLSAAALITQSYGHAPAYDRPIHSILICSIACVVALIIADRFRPECFKLPTSTRASHDYGTSLQDLDIYQHDSQRSAPAHKGKGWFSSGQLPLILVGIILLTARIEVFRQILQNVQCTSRSYAVFLPLLLALYDVRKQSRVRFDAREHEDMYDGIFTTLKLELLKSKWRHVPAAFLLSVSLYAITGLWQSRTSTYICPIASGHARITPQWQQLAVILDLALIVVVEKLSRLPTRTSMPPLSILKAYSVILLGATSFSVGYSTVLFFARPEYQSWLFLLDLPVKSTYFLSLFWQLALLSTLSVTLAYCIIHHGIFLTTALLTAVFTILPGLSLVYHTGQPFPPVSLPTLIWAFPCALVALWMIHVTRQSMGSASAPIWHSWMLIPIFLCIYFIFPGITQRNYIHFHPIDLLMYDAKDQHSRYIQYASHSKDLKAAVSVYTGRYKSEPPPGFDLWWEFAQNRSVTITDDFDQIFLDLLPFRTVLPADIRRQTWEMVSNPWNEISGISIRNGSADIQANAAPTHRWMLEGVTTLINSFAQHLPDMDLAFNLNDECRVALPYSDSADMIERARAHALNGSSSWSESRSTDWLPVAEEEFHESVFENWSFQNTFARFGSAGCKSNSPAQSRGRRTGQTHLCTECAAPHSVSQFVRDWYQAADPCHQPDLAALHGFYLSPAAFKGSRKLLPVFSQSKAHGYNDILYPSAWNYMDKVKYNPTNSSGVAGADDYVAGHPDPSFSEKENMLYWRGATTEGVSAGEGAWQGMTRQRLVHMVNNLTTSHHDHATVLLPETGSDGPGYTYKSLSARSLFGLGLQADVKLVDRIVRCGGVDCTDQEAEFGLVGPVDFQEHWRYRYLFDMDGAGFSGRFLPFLQSHSLPFKTGLFREWYDSRITAWRHFVPQDIRLHGVWSTLAYFAGVNGVVDGKHMEWDGHAREAELIAEEGRSWAEQALRKEDMEVYFFRLLLEWGRLTDDRRDELGFVPP